MNIYYYYYYYMLNGDITIKILSLSIELFGMSESAWIASSTRVDTMDGFHRYITMILPYRKHGRSHLSPLPDLGRKESSCDLLLLL